jgi:hypothetical protein
MSHMVSIEPAAVRTPPGRSLRAPSLAQVFRQQLKLIDQAGAGSMGFLVLGGATLLFLGMDMERRIAGFAFPTTYLPLSGILLGSVAFPPLVWRGQGPTQRNYHRTLPVDHLTHDLLKIAAGAVWLMLGIAIVLIPLLVSAASSSVLTGLLEASPLVWVNFFTGPLIAYLLISCVPMLTNRPLEWLVGLFAGMTGVQVFATTYGVFPIDELLDTIVRGNGGLAIALYGAYNEEPWLQHVNVLYHQVEPDYTSWIGATLLWLVIGVGAVCWASHIANSRKTA